MASRRDCLGGWADLSVALYVLPFALRVGVHPEGLLSAPLSGAALSIAPPLVVALSSVQLPSYLADREVEHELRHAVYALAFCVAAGTSVRWDVVWSAWADDGAPWAPALTGYLLLGALTLWWFVASHVLENRCAPWLYTHQGDVAVLPLTLVAIATFASDVPDAAFRYSRSVVYFVPVVVAWATLYFIAHNEFAVRRTTTLESVGFDFLAFAALVIASAHLCLLEVAAPPLAFVAFAPVAALLCQVTPRPAAAPTLHEGRLLPALVVDAALSAAVGALLASAPGASPAPLWVCPTVGTAFALSVPRVAGEAWPVPAALYATLVAAATLDAADPGRLGALDVAALGAAYVVSFLVARALVGESCVPPAPPLPPTDRAAPRASPLVAAVYAGLGRWALPEWLVRRRYEEATVLSDLFAGARPDTPAWAAGVWWMRGNALPMDLVVLHQHRWTADGTATATVGTSVTRRATVAGLVQGVFGAATTLHVGRAREGDDPRWIRTEVWWGGPLRLMRRTLWLFRVSDDEMLRLVYDGRGRLTWRYRLLRLARAPGVRTRLLDAFLNERGGAAYLAHG